VNNRKPIDAVQVKLIHIAKAKLCLSDVDYRTLLSERYWVNTCKELSYDEATDLIKHFQTQGFKIITKRHNHLTSPIPSLPRRGKRGGREAGGVNNITRLVSPQQLAKIEHLRADIQWRIKPDGYCHWLRKYLKKDRITTEKEARNVIEALKGMVQRQGARERQEAE
jgi:hypothetical protein